jgi:hypothetical protein
MEKPHKKLDILKKSTPDSRLPTPLILLIIISAALCLYLYAAHFRATGLFHDDGIYLVNAKSLDEGTGYRTSSLPESPPQTKYPPVFSLILSFLWRINPSFPDNIHLMRLFSALCAVSVLFLAWSYLQLKSSHKTLLLFLLLSALAFNPYFALLAGQVMSEMPFTFFSLASIVLFLHYERHGGKTSLLSSFLLAVIAFYTRTIGAALFFSFVLWFFYQRRFKAAFLLSGITLAAVLPWFYWVSINTPAADSLVSTFYSSYSSWFLLANQPISYDISFFVKQFASMALRIPMLLCPSCGVNLPSLIFDIFFWFFLLVGILNQFRRSPSVDTFYLIITAAIVAVWSPGLDTTRFWVPLLPIFLFCLMDGIMTTKEDLAALSHRFRNIVRPLWLMGVAALLTGIFLVGIPRTPGVIRGTIFNSEPIFTCMEEASNWIGDNTKKGDVIASHLDPLVYLLSGRQAINVAWGNCRALLQEPEKFYSEDDILGAFKEYGISHLLVVYLEQGRLEDRLRNDKLSEIIMKYPDAFHLLHKKEGLFAIYRVKPQYLWDKE